MPNPAPDRASACALLRQKADELRADGLTRYPQRSDFSATQVVFIKAHLGPWPRALEAAGLKPPREDGGTAEHDRARRARQKELRRPSRAPDKPEDGSCPEGRTE